MSMLLKFMVLPRPTRKEMPPNFRIIELRLYRSEEPLTLSVTRLKTAPRNFISAITPDFLSWITS